MMEIFVLWMAIKGGADAKGLCDAWESAPKGDLGLTVYNGNDFINQRFRWEQETGDPLLRLGDAAAAKCRLKHMFMINDGNMFPSLRPQVYPGLMERARCLLREHQHFVEAGSEFVGKVKLRDSMHFARESTQAVVAMLFRVVNGGLLDTLKNLRTPRSRTMRWYGRLFVLQPFPQSSGVLNLTRQ